MHTLDQLFEQATIDSYSKCLVQKGIVSYICYGFKIVKEKKSDKISILDMTTSGDFYREINKDEYNDFKKLGWKIAIYVLYLSNCRSKLEKLEARINVAIVNNESIKLIRKLKANREQILSNFNKVKIKLN